MIYIAEINLCHFSGLNESLLFKGLLYRTSEIQFRMVSWLIRERTILVQAVNELKRLSKVWFELEFSTKKQFC